MVWFCLAFSFKGVLNPDALGLTRTLIFDMMLPALTWYTHTHTPEPAGKKNKVIQDRFVNGDFYLDYRYTSDSSSFLLVGQMVQ